MKVKHGVGTAQGAAVVDMEEEFLNLGLDIIGLGVFNYDFGSITRESPVIKARALQTASAGWLSVVMPGLFVVMPARNANIPSLLHSCFPVLNVGMLHIVAGK